MFYKRQFYLIKMCEDEGSVISCKPNFVGQGVFLKINTKLWVLQVSAFDYCAVHLRS